MACKPTCGHQAYDPKCSEYPPQPCCGYPVHLDELGQADSELHLETCPTQQTRSTPAPDRVTVE